MKGIFHYLTRIFTPHRYSGPSEEFDEVKQSRATHLARLDRQLSEEEWQEFGRLVKEGY